MEGAPATGEVPPLDVEAAVTAFLRDPERTSLELPPMAANQRKLAKAVADRYPELTCESYGLGTERRLHLFKKGIVSKEDGAGSVSVKNTFIDDWISPMAAEGGAEPVIFRSMPPQLPQAAAQQRSSLALPSCLLAGGGKLDLSPINEGSPKWPAEPPGAGAVRRDGAESQAALSPPPPPPATIPVPAAARGGPASVLGERTEASAQPALVEGFGVRNTFIHIDCGGMPPDARSVQSMPHDMFRRCLEEEAGHLSALVAAAAGATTVAVAPAPPVAVPAAPALPGAPAAGSGDASTRQPVPVPAAGSGDASTRQPPSMPPILTGDPMLDPSMMLVPGLQVVIQGLTKLPAFNGQTGVLEGLDEATGRYSVLLSGARGASGQPQRAKVKAENLRPAALPPPPPPFAPALDRLGMPGDPMAAYGGLSSIPTTPLWAEDAFTPSPLRLTELV